MKSIFLTIIFASFLTPCFAQEKEVEQFSVSNLELKITNVNKGKDKLEIEIFFKNKNSESVLTVSPIIEDSFKTNYFLGFDEKNNTLQIRKHLFLYPNYVTDMIEPCFILKVVKAGDSYSEKFTLDFPLVTNSYFFSQEVDISKYDKFSVQIGVLPFDKAIYQIQDRRPFGHCVLPNDVIEQGVYKNKTLMEVQKILSTD